ncbi:Protein of unknown function [Rhizobiales bacterium GAS191]|nr:Protein of unknown function [Rhizobiales bacterium GAS191]
MTDLAVPRLEHVADLEIGIAAPIEIGETAVGERRVIPITGGIVKGPRLNGRILPAGADFQIIRPDGVTELVARYVIEAGDGALIYIENSGIRHGPPELIVKLRRGEEVDPGLIYFRTAPRFETASPRHQFLMRHLFIGVGARYPDRVALAVWLVT